MSRTPGRVRLAAATVALSLPFAGCSMFGSDSAETAAERNARVQEQVDTAVAPLRKEVGELRDVSENNTREIGVLKTEVEVIKRDASRRPVITPTDIGSGTDNPGGMSPVPGATGVVDTAGADAEAQRLARQRAIEEQIARESAEAERLARERADAERRRREQADQERIAREQADQERQAREQADRERAAREQAEQERLAREKADQERLAREKAEQERIAREKAEAEARAAASSSGTAPSGGTGVTTAKVAPGGTGFEVPKDATPEEKAALLTNALRTTSDVESVARQMRDVSSIVAPSLIRMLGDSDITAKFRAEKALSFLDPKVVSPLLLDQLKKPQVQLPTIKILGNLGDPAAVPALSGFLSNENRDLRFYAADSLVKLREKKAIPALIEYLKGSDTAKSAIAYDTLSQRTGQNIKFPFFGSREEREKYAAAWEQWWKENGAKFEFK